MEEAPIQCIEPDAVTVLNPNGRSPYVLICEHASNYIPEVYQGLGLSPSERESHIAWDPGAGTVACSLSHLLDAPLFLSNYSRLLIDCNRVLSSNESIAIRSEETNIPGNAGLSDSQIETRGQSYFVPFHRKISDFLDRRLAEGQHTKLLSLHSFVPIFRGKKRHWNVGVLYGKPSALTKRLIAGFERRPKISVGDNEPYRVDTNIDYTIPIHGDNRGLAAALLEIRQDHLVSPVDVQEWAMTIAGILRSGERPEGRVIS